MEQITEFCTGCSSCEKSCPKDAIKMMYNEEGFLEAKIDQDKCIDCKLCIKKCPQESYILSNEIKHAYGVVLKNKEELMKSASGGAFMAFAKTILESNGIVYGCAFNNDFDVEHIRINKKEDLIKLQGSKYVQSNTKNTYLEVKEDLNNGRIVLYSGTPCQIAGLYLSLGKKYSNLYTVDLICHGVPSPLMFKEYIKWKEEQLGGRIKLYSFRYKDKGYGGRYLVRVETNKKVRQYPIMIDPYGDAFLTGKTFRECCYKCKYSNCNRVGDITVGDFWGFDNKELNENVNSGVSLVLINSMNGENLFNKSNKEIYYVKSSIENARKYNEGLNHSVRRPDIRSNIYRGFTDKDYFSIKMKTGLKLKLRISNLIPIEIKEKIKRIRNGVK